MATPQAQETGLTTRESLLTLKDWWSKLTQESAILPGLIIRAGAKQRELRLVAKAGQLPTYLVLESKKLLAAAELTQNRLPIKLQESSPRQQDEDIEMSNFNFVLGNATPFFNAQYRKNVWASPDRESRHSLHNHVWFSLKLFSPEAFVTALVEQLQQRARQENAASPETSQAKKPIQVHESLQPHLLNKLEAIKKDRLATQHLFANGESAVSLHRITFSQEFDLELEFRHVYGQTEFHFQVVSKDSSGELGRQFQQEKRRQRIAAVVEAVSSVNLTRAINAVAPEQLSSIVPLKPELALHELEEAQEVGKQLRGYLQASGQSYEPHHYGYANGQLRIPFATESGQHTLVFENRVKGSEQNWLPQVEFNSHYLEKRKKTYQEQAQLTINRHWAELTQKDLYTINKPLTLADLDEELHHRYIGYLRNPNQEQNVLSRVSREYRRARLQEVAEQHMPPELRERLAALQNGPESAEIDSNKTIVAPRHLEDYADPKTGLVWTGVLKGWQSKNGQLRPVYELQLYRAVPKNAAAGV